MSDTATAQNPPKSSPVRRMMLEYILMLGAVFISSYFHYGLTSLLLTATGAAAAVLCRRAGVKLFKIQNNAGDFSAFVAGVSCAMLLPPTAGWWMALFAGIFASAVCIIPFGSSEKSPFVPAAAAICFVSLCWPDKIFEYSQSGLLGLSKMLIQNNSIGKNWVAILEVLTGNIPSALGTGSILTLLGALVFLTVLRPKNSVPVYSFLLAVSLMALAFPRVSTGRFVSLVMELCSGMLLFSAVFFMSYPSVMPQRLVPRALWGFAGGIICMLIRYFGTLEESVCFGILITDSLSGLFDMLPLLPYEKRRLEKMQPYTEVAAVTVPDEVLKEIPDEPQALQSGEEEEASAVLQESEDLNSVISEENTVSDTETPFAPGGDANEQ